jgi:hypothetical protein
MSLFNGKLGRMKIPRAPSFRLFSGERVGDLNTQSSLYMRSAR